MKNKLPKAFKLLEQGHRPQAEDFCRSVLAEEPENPDAMNLMGLIERDRGSMEQARSWFQKGLEIAPGNLNLLNSIGLVEQTLGNYAQSGVHFKHALELDPNFFYARFNLANLFQSQRDFTQAKRLYLDVIEQRPNFVDALANLSFILESEHQMDQAKTFADRALQINPDHFVARQTLAKIAARDASFDEVIDLMLPFTQSKTPTWVDYALACGMCADAYDKLGDYTRAFAFYQDANQALEKVFAPEMQHLESFHTPNSVECIGNAITHFDFSNRSDEPTSPVFLIGFPRSGTSLLDQILSSHSRITVLEEKENLVDTYTRFEATEKGLNELEHATEAELDTLREKYLENLHGQIPTNKLTRIVVDKLPLNAIALLHIFKLFPKARIIVALRDPRDTVLSCYQQKFDMNLAMFQFLNLDTAVSYYNQVMNVIVKMCDARALPMHFIRYENVVENFAGEVKALADFLDLEWEDAFFDYQKTAKARHISTPSASQVIRPLYTSSIGKWKHYQEWIGTSFEPLDRWVEEWGYRK